MLKFTEYQVCGQDAPKQLVVLLHGYGSNKDDLINIAPDLAAYLPNAHFISPDAPEPFENAQCQGYRQWFSLEDRSPEAMLSGATSATVILKEFLIAQLKRFSLSEDDLALVGFSQGAMMALHMGLRTSLSPKVLICYSGMLIAANKLQVNKERLPEVALIHGANDVVVPIDAMRLTAITLTKQNVSLHTKICPQLEHGIDKEGAKFGAKLLKSLFT